MNSISNSYRIVLARPDGLSRSQLFVDFSPSYDRKPHPDIQLEQAIEEVWKQRISTNPSLYNGKKFRYGGCRSLLCDGKSLQMPPNCLCLGLTDYRTFIGTNLAPSWENFLVPVEDDAEQCAHVSSPLGNGAVVETKDNYIVVLERSHNVGEFPGHLVFPGGHSESDPIFIGVSRRALNVRPTAFFFIKCSLDSAEVYDFYAKAEDGFESTNLHMVPKSELACAALKMPGCHRGGFALYELMVKKQEAPETL
eukprot:TRINITY_DN3408_c0_g1_i2.p1 TRINITY_DN3408_c0_g1~~TRINITY_DN3408_c0_g1_i2.p1  ORF type:complete len:252 (-),score=45.56 TRINITY_DN3408_c0_g1_i2:432-1187(-)